MSWLSVLMAMCRASPSVERRFVEMFSKLTPISFNMSEIDELTERNALCFNSHIRDVS